MVLIELREAWNRMVCPDMACGSVIAQPGPQQCDLFNRAYLSTVHALMVQRDAATGLQHSLQRALLVRHNSQVRESGQAAAPPALSLGVLL